MTTTTSEMNDARQVTTVAQNPQSKWPHGRPGRRRRTDDGIALQAVLARWEDRGDHGEDGGYHQGRADPFQQRPAGYHHGQVGRLKAVIVAPTP